MSTQVQTFDYIMDVNGGEGDWSNILWRLQDWKFYRESGRWGTAGSSSTHPWNNIALGRSRSGPPTNQRAGPTEGTSDRQATAWSYFVSSLWGRLSFTAMHLDPYFFYLVNKFQRVFFVWAFEDFIDCETTKPSFSAFNSGIVAFL